MKKICVSLTILLSTSVLTLSAFGQTSKRRQPQTPPAAATTESSKTRARRAGTTTTSTTPAPTPATPAPESPVTDVSNTADATAQTAPKEAPKPAEKPSVPTPEKTVTPKPESSPAPADPLLTLRDQIEAAETPQERLGLQLKLADQLVAAGKKDQALAQLHEITNSNVFDPQGLYNVGNALARLGDSDEAINAYRKAIEQRKGIYSRALNNLGVVLLRLGRWDEAYDALRSALKIENFRYAEASYNLGRLYAARGETDLAIREWRRVLAIDPQHSAAAQAIARAGSEGRVVVETVSVKPAAPAAPAAPARAEKRNVVSKPESNDKPVAVKPSPSPRSSKVLSVDQATYDFLQRARNSSERGNAQDAVANYRRVISRQGGYFAPANLELSYLLVSLKQFDEALANLLLVTNRDGARYPISYFHLARLYESKGDLKQAEANFARVAAAYGSTNGQFLLDLSRVREKQENYKGALEALEQYVAFMQQKGQTMPWFEERLAALRQKAK